MLPVFDMLGEPGPTIHMTMSNVAQSLAAGVLTVGGKACKAVMITVESGYGIVVGFGGTVPTQWGGDYDTPPTAGHTLWVIGFFGPVSSTWELRGSSIVATLKMIAGKADEANIVAITPFY